MIMRKKGIGVVVVVALIILVVAVAIAWKFVVPAVQDNSEFGSYGADIEIETEGGNTYFDSKNGIACVQIKRKSIEKNLTRIDVLFVYGGETIDDKGNFFSDEIPGIDKLSTKCFNVSSLSFYGGTRYLVPDAIRLLPIYFDGGEEVEGAVVSIVGGDFSGDISDIRNGNYSGYGDLGVIGG